MAPVPPSVYQALIDRFHGLVQIDRRYDTLDGMRKLVVDLTRDELRELAAEAGAEAIRDTLAADVPVTGTSDDYPGISKLYPDGSIKPLNAIRKKTPSKLVGVSA